MSPMAGRMPGTQGMSVLQGRGVRPARAGVLCEFGVGHLVTHNLIKINGTSKAPRVTEVISAAADLWEKISLALDLGHLLQISSQVVSDFTPEVSFFF